MMGMEKKRIVVIISEFKTDRVEKENDWIYDRMDIFMQFTAQCLINQSNDNFIALYSYEDSLENDIEQAMGKYSKLPTNIRFIKLSEYMKVLDDITEGYDELLLSKLDSDNLYSNDFVERLIKYDLKEYTEELLCRNGYIYDVINNRLAEYFNKRSAFYTFVYRLSNDENKYINLDISPIELLTGFPEFRVIDHKCDDLKERNFMVMIHKDSKNKTFSDYNYGFNKVERFITNKEEIEKILYEFL